MMMFFGWVLASLGLGFLAYQFGWGSRDRRGTASDKSALDILKERYVRGELSRDEFMSMREDLEN